MDIFSWLSLIEELGSIKDKSGAVEESFEKFVDGLYLHLSVKEEDKIRSALSDIRDYNSDRGLLDTFKGFLYDFGIVYRRKIIVYSYIAVALAFVTSRVINEKFRSGTIVLMIGVAALLLMEYWSD